VGRLTLTSRTDASDGAQLTIAGGRMTGPRPAAAQKGTVIELRDLFYATPARLKFLRTDRAEAQAIAEVVRRLAMAEPSVGFTLTEVAEGEAPRLIFRADAQSGDFFDALHGRLTGILGADFTANALQIDVERDGLRLTGYAALPTYSRGSSVQQFVFVNGRPVLDRVLLGALRVAYFDFLSRDRHPAAVLNLICDPERVDVNVHPAKSEVRFREPEAARGLIITGLGCAPRCRAQATAPAPPWPMPLWPRCAPRHRASTKWTARHRRASPAPPHGRPQKLLVSQHPPVSPKPRKPASNPPMSGQRPTKRATPSAPPKRSCTAITSSPKPRAAS
jgi:DNA mismatch repair protein MutL